MAFTQNNLATLARQPQNGKVQILPADAQAQKTVYTAGASGSKVSSLIGTSTDTAAHDVQISITNGVVTTVNEAVTSTTPDTAFRWDATNQQWIFNMSTKTSPQNVANQTYYYRIDLNDGTSIYFQFGLK